MPIGPRDATILTKIVKYCDDIDKTNDFFGNSKEGLQQNDVYANALAMCVLQIGELTTHISEKFRDEYADIPWADIRGMRNIAVHHYGDFSIKYLWDTVNNDIPGLRAFCEERLSEYEQQIPTNR
jgi:uncharacterized protein with HEPN domain